MYQVEELYEAGRAERVVVVKKMDYYPSLADEPKIWSGRRSKTFSQMREKRSVIP